MPGTTVRYARGSTVQASSTQSSNLAVYGTAVFLTTLGIVYVQDAERQIPMTYASRYQAGALQRQAYLPFKVSGCLPALLSSLCLSYSSSLCVPTHLPASQVVQAYLPLEARTRCPWEVQANGWGEWWEGGGRSGRHMFFRKKTSR
jgi:preprotein translocase subunit SecY